MDKQQITELIASIDNIVHHTIQKNYHVQLNNDGYQDVYQDCMTAIIKKAESYNPKKGRFGTYIYYTLRNAVLRSIASNNTISYSCIDTYNRVKYNNKKERLHIKINLDELAKREQDQEESYHNVIGTVNFDYGTMNDRPDYLRKALNETEYTLLMELYKLPKRRDSSVVLKSLRKLAKLPDKRLMHSSYLVYWRRRLTKKVCDYYATKGYKVTYPSAYGNCKIPAKNSTTTGLE